MPHGQRDRVGTGKLIAVLLTAGKHHQGQKDEYARKGSFHTGCLLKSTNPSRFPTLFRENFRFSHPFRAFGWGQNRGNPQNCNRGTAPVENEPPAGVQFQGAICFCAPALQLFIVYIGALIRSMFMPLNSKKCYDDEAAALHINSVLDRQCAMLCNVLHGEQ